MSRPTSRRKAAYRKRDCYANAVQIAINRVRKLSAADVAMQSTLAATAVREFSQGINCAARWRDLADISNLTESLSRLRICSGDQADELIAGAQQALADVHVRHAERGTWTLYADEIDVLQWLVSLHTKQLQECSYGEFEDALQQTKHRLEAARAGNASPNAVVVMGLVGAGEVGGGS